MLETRVLRYFLTVAREGSITKAANRLHVTQPTLSRQIQDLEERLGVKLLVRSSHSVSLTQEGILLRRRAEEILDLCAKTESELKLNGNELSGDVYIGGGETIAFKFVSDVIAAVQQEHPKIKFHIFSGNAEDVTYRLDRGLCDFGILLEPADINKYDYLRLPSEDRWGLFMPRSSPLAQKSSIKVEDVLDLPLILSKQAIEVQDNNTFVNWFGEDFDKLRIVADYNLLYNATLMVKSGMGYVISVDKIVDAEHDPDLCFRPLEPEIRLGLLIVWKKYQIFSPCAQSFMLSLKDSLDKMGLLGMD